MKTMCTHDVLGRWLHVLFGPWMIEPAARATVRTPSIVERAVARAGGIPLPLDAHFPSRVTLEESTLSLGLLDPLQAHATRITR